MGMGMGPGPGPGPRRGPPLPRDASPTLYIEGVPHDATVREIAHIFRPFDGFQSTRLVKKENVRGPLCFAEFAGADLAFAALNTLQGYVLDRDDPKSPALRIVFAKSKGRVPPGKGGPGGGGAGDRGGRR